MSWEVLRIVFSRRAGSSHRKAILAYCADKASDDGSGVFVSKGRLARETEIGRSTVFRVMQEMEREGILIRTGTRGCRNGETVVYTMNVDMIEAWPATYDQAREQVSGLDQSKGPTSPAAGPRTLLQHPDEPEAVAAAARAPESPSLREQVMAAAGVPSSRAIPTHWMPPAADLHCRRWVTDLGLTEAEIIDVAKASRARHADPPGSPRAFDRDMQRLASQKSAPAMKPIGPANEHSRPHRRTAADADRAAAEARQALTDGRITSVIAGPFAPGASRRR